MSLGLASKAGLLALRRAAARGGHAKVQAVQGDAAEWHVERVLQVACLEGLQPLS